MTKVGYRITGGNVVKGKVTCMGAKNFATKAMIASLLSQDKSTLQNMPHIGDVEITQALLESAGATFIWSDDHTLVIDPSNLNSNQVAMKDSRTNRIPILLLSVLLQKFGRAVVPTVGGDDIGKRNVDFHIGAIQRFGANVKMEDNNYIAELVAGRLKGCHVTLPYPSVGATETCLFLSVLADGTSVIKNIAIEPEIMALITMLRSMGAIIFLDSNRCITVHGVDKLTSTNIHMIGDRIEAASWACLACAADGEIEVSGIRPDLLGNFLSYYNSVGGGYHLVDANTITFYRKHALHSAHIETDVYPGFSTDWQQPFAVLLTQSYGMSVIHETVYEQRFGYLDVLNKLGAKTQVVKACLGSLPCRYKGFDHAHSALIYGRTILHAIDEPIIVPDIRGGLAYLIAAALAEGTTTLLNAEQIERGYGNLIHKLADVNLQIFLRGYL
jgi:UDP-N-acetylglucosamine 1-carboxyvinyltransferase